MARAVRYMVHRSEAQSRLEPETAKAEIERPQAKVRAIASRAARQAARNAPPRVKKSSAKRAAEEVSGLAKQTDIESPEAMKQVIRAARRAGRGTSVSPAAKRGSRTS